MTENQYARVKRDLAATYGWTPETINNLTLREALFWHSGESLTHEQAMMIFLRRQGL